MPKNSGKTEAKVVPVEAYRDGNGNQIDLNLRQSKSNKSAPKKKLRLVKDTWTPANPSTKLF